MGPEELEEMDRRWVGPAVCLGVVCLLLVAGVAVAKPSSDTSTVTWTFAVYVDGNNNLAKYWAEYSLPWLQAVPASDRVHIVALVSLANATSAVVETISGAAVTVVETEPVLDMGSPDTLSWWITKSADLFRSTYYALDIWDHGWGWKYVSVDDASGHRLSMPQLEAAIATANRPISILAFDACDMGNAEVAYQVAETSLVSYLVGSEESVPYQGFPYDRMLTPLAADPGMTPRDLSIAMVDGWGAYYGGVNWAHNVNLAAYELASLHDRAAAFGDWAGAMRADLPAYRKAYTSVLKAAYAAAGTRTYSDLTDFAAHLLAAKGVTDPALRAATANLKTWVASFVVRVWNGAKMGSCGGVTFYFGIGNDWASSSAAYLGTAFAVDTGWGGFLTAYNT